MGLTEFLATYITKFIDFTGYVSVYVLMVMESMVFPIPSEAVMPFAGFLISDGRFTFPGVIIISTFGSITGSILSYYIGKKGGKPFVNKFGKFFLIDMEELEATEKFFKKYGEVTVFFCRFIPIIRHLISIPAGVANMNLLRFSILTIIGAGIWNTFLTVCGFFLKQNWELVMKYSKTVDIVIIILGILAVGFYIYRHLNKSKKKKAS